MSKYREESHKQWKEQYFRMRQEKSNLSFRKRIFYEGIVLFKTGSRGL